MMVRRNPFNNFPIVQNLIFSYFIGLHPNLLLSEPKWSGKVVLFHPSRIIWI
jgi:hypothetical protein